MDLVNDLIKEGWLKTPRIIETFKKIKRADFLPREKQQFAELNEALPIGYKQTISQPLVVAFMLELLQPSPDDKILDIGCGSGWTSALLAEIIKGKGRVVALEIVPELVEFGKANTNKYGFVKSGRVKFIKADGSLGYKKEAPYDCVLSSASAEKLPPAWKKQVKIGGRIVAVIQNSICLFIKKSESDFAETCFPGFVFVPLVKPA